MIYSFADCELDTERFELRRGGAVQHVQPQVFDILRYLVERHERFVTKDELYEAVWRGRLVSEAGLSSRMKSVRRAIGDNGTDQRLIRTAHGRGFRFIAPVTIRTAEEETGTRQPYHSNSPPHPSDLTPVVHGEHQDVVNVAAQIEGMTRPSATCASDVVRRVGEKTQVRFANVGKPDDKNISRGVAGAGANPSRSEAFNNGGFRWRWLAAVGVVTLLTVGGLLTWGVIDPQGPRSSAAACTDHLGLPVAIEKCSDIQQQD